MAELLFPADSRLRQIGARVMWPWTGVVLRTELQTTQEARLIGMEYGGIADGGEAFDGGK